MRRGHSISPIALTLLLIVAVLLMLSPQVWAQEGAKLLCEPNKGTYGYQVFLKGSGFAPNSQVQIEAFGQTIAPQSDNTGQFMVIAFAPTDQAKFKPGPYTLKAKDAAGHSAEAAFTLEELVTAPRPTRAAVTPAEPGAKPSVPAASGSVPPPPPPSPPPPPGEGGNVGLLVGVVVAGGIGLALLAFAVFFFVTRRRQPTRPSRPAVDARQTVTSMPKPPRPVAAPEPTSPGESTPKPAAGPQEGETTLVMPALPKLSTRPTLQVVRGEGEGTVYPLEQKTTVIGRGEDCDIIVDHPMVSRHHAKIVRVGPSYYVHDLQSTNGTLVNGQRIDQYVLQSEDEVQIGVTVLLFDQPTAQ